MSVLKTVYDHECEHCVYLGPHAEAGTVYDLYWCVQGLPPHTIPTVISRFSSDGPDYNSGMVFADNGMIPQLVEAKKRAVMLGLDVSDGGCR